jgi:hypothetical protein
MPSVPFRIDMGQVAAWQAAMAAAEAAAVGRVVAAEKAAEAAKDEARRARRAEEAVQRALSALQATDSVNGTAHPVERTDESSRGEWTIGSWLASLNVLPMVAEAQSPPDRQSAFAFVKTGLNAALDERLQAARLEGTISRASYLGERLAKHPCYRRSHP